MHEQKIEVLAYALQACFESVGLRRLGFKIDADKKSMFFRSSEK